MPKAPNGLQLDENVMKKVAKYKSSELYRTSIRIPLSQLKRLKRTLAVRYVTMQDAIIEAVDGWIDKGPRNQDVPGGISAEDRRLVDALLHMLAVQDEDKDHRMKASAVAILEWWRENRLPRERSGNAQ